VESSASWKLRLLSLLLLLFSLSLLSLLAVPLAGNLECCNHREEVIIGITYA
jgi:hypothetical protein